MNAGDFMLCTFEGDTSSPFTQYVAEITSVDSASQYFSCKLANTGQRFTFQYSTNASGPWSGTDDAGANYVIDSHDIYTPAGRDPSPQDVAVVSFDDGQHYLCYVENISPTVDVVFYHYPYRVSIDLNVITSSDWDIRPVGTHVVSIEGCSLNNEVAVPSTGGAFQNGWWSLATQRNAHSGRVGGNIQPFSTVVHTTDVVPEAWNTLLNSWVTQAGDGSCAHFAVGRNANEGLLQLVPITRNANHAGGPGHGNFVANGQSWHPNLVSVGIELHSAGLVRRVNGQWRLVENGVPQGHAIPDSDVIPRPQSPDLGWHVVTEYQYEQLDALLTGLESVLNPLPAGCVAQSIEQPPAYGVFPTGRIVGHVSLTAARRGDPWPPTCDWLRARTS